MQDSRFKRGLACYFVIATLALIWPIYPFFSGIHPRVFGMPFSLVWILVVLILSFSILASVYLWESRTGRLD